MKDPIPKFGDPIGPWRKFFAWFPIRTYDSELLWLVTVARRRIQKHDYLTGGADQWWQYGRASDFL